MASNLFLRPLVLFELYKKPLGVMQKTSRGGMHPEKKKKKKIVKAK